MNLFAGIVVDSFNTEGDKLSKIIQILFTTIQFIIYYQIPFPMTSPTPYPPVLLSNLMNIFADWTINIIKNN